jgi:hypothetical protein
MRYLVILDVRSASGAVYHSGSNDGYVSDGDLRHPVLDCSEIVVDSPYYLFAKRDMAKQGGSYQSLYIPHSSVVHIHCYADSGTRPMGFIPPNSGNDS